MRVALASLISLAVLASVAVTSLPSSGPPPEKPRAQLRLLVDDRVVMLRVSRYLDGRGHISQQALIAAIRRSVRETAVTKTDRARIVQRRDLDRAARDARRAGPRGGTVRVSSETVASTIQVPVLQQDQRNTCESAAAEILSAAAGRRLDQRQIQAAIPRSGPPDPIETPDGRIWGDPERGYVGRPDGGGTAGGFGVYPGPVLVAAQRLNLPFVNLTGQGAAAVYRRLLTGRAVLAWVGLSDGPYGTWSSPRGRAVRVNFGEHTVVLHGLRTDGSVLVSNPLEGTREVWSKSEFEQRFELLGGRAITVR